jgi:hypothetical protein
MSRIAGTRRVPQERKHTDDVLTTVVRNCGEERLHSPAASTTQPSSGITPRTRQGEDHAPPVVGRCGAVDPVTFHQVVDQPADGALREPETSDEICLPQRPASQLSERVSIGDSSLEPTRRALGTMKTKGPNERDHRVGEAIVIRHSSKIQPVACLVDAPILKGHVPR